MDTIEPKLYCDFCLNRCSERQSCPLCLESRMLLCEECMDKHLELHDKKIFNPEEFEELYRINELSKQNNTGLC